MTNTGKHARKRYGTRVAAKQAKSRRSRRKSFGKLPVSVSRGNADQFNRDSQEALAKAAEEQASVATAERSASQEEAQ